MVNGKEDALANPFKLNQDATAKMIDNIFNSSLSASFAGKGINFVSQTAYQSNYRYYDQPLDGDFSPIDGVTIINNYGNKWNNDQGVYAGDQVQLTGVGQFKIKVDSRCIFFYQNIPNKQAVHFGDDAALVGAPDTNFSVINTTKGKSIGWAFSVRQVIRSMSNWISLQDFVSTRNIKSTVYLDSMQKDPDPRSIV